MSSLLLNANASTMEHEYELCELSALCVIVAVWSVCDMCWAGLGWMIEYRYDGSTEGRLLG